MTIRDLDNHIRQELAKGPCTPAVIFAGIEHQGCTVYDLNAALRIWERNFWAQRTADGCWSLGPRGPEFWKGVK